MAIKPSCNCWLVNTFRSTRGRARQPRLPGFSATSHWSRRPRVAQQIIVNTLYTLETARQLDYLRKSDLIDNQWKVVIEIHYYRERDTSMTAFHKDTRGQTLFVNLNFVAGDPDQEEKLLGPEYVLNPPTSNEYEKWVQSSGNLPAAFVADLKSAKSSLDRPAMIEATRVPAKGFVAFVDEMIHHKTPTRGHRSVDEIWINSILRASNHRADFASAERAFKQYKAQQSSETKPLQSYLPDEWNVDKREARQKIMLTIGESKLAFDRDQLAVLFPESAFPDRDELIERMIEKGGFSDFGKVSLTHASTSEDLVREDYNDLEVKQPRSEKPLKRRMSQWLASDKGTGHQEKKEMPPQRPVRSDAAFFRT